MEQRAVIAVITSTRAEYGLLRPVLEGLEARSEIETRLVVTGSHLCAALGNTVSEIEADGRAIAARIPILGEDGNDPAAPESEVTARAIVRIAAWLRENPCALVLLLGDRYEILAAAIAAFQCGIPIAHISGGDVTEGARDDAYRHCITKLSSLHFPSCEDYAARVIRLGEPPESVVTAGELGAENAARIPPIDAETLSADLGFDCSRRFLLVTCHPETGGLGADCVLPLLEALDAFALPVLFTKANADAGGDLINRRIEAWCETHPDSKLFPSLGVRRYLSAMRLCAAVAGNSSSAVIEAPALGVPAVDIGARQKGRTRRAGVLNPACEAGEILDALRTACRSDFRKGLASAELCGCLPSGIIVSEILRRLPQGIKKLPFYDAPCGEKEGDTK